MPDPAAAVDALGTAWTVFNLYPDPADQPAFRRAVEHLQASAVDGLRIGVEATGFVFDSKPLSLDREGATRLASQCFLHRILSVAVDKDISAEDVARFFVLLSRPEPEVAVAGGFGTALLRDGVISLRVSQRGALAESGAPSFSRPDFVQKIVDAVDHPESLAADLAAGGATSEEIGQSLVHGYQAALNALQEADTEGREAVVQAYVEAFFHLEPPAQDAAFAEFLSSDDLADRAFLDQFAGHELAAMAPRLDAKGLTLLLDYAKVATDQADGRPGELISILSDTDAIMSARRLAASKIHDRMAGMSPMEDSAEAAVRTLQSQIPDPETYFDRSIGGFRSLLTLEQRPDRFDRILRSWGAAVVGEVEAGEFGRATAWFDALTADPPYAGHLQSSVAETVASTATADVILATVDAKGPASAAFLQRLSRHAMIPIIDALAEQDDASRRRVLLDALTSVARENPTVIVSRLGDDRWYVVRNLVVALRNVNQPEVVAATRRLLQHPEPRVRVEALRSVVRGGDDVLAPLRRALTDDDSRVREAAISLLGELGDAVGHRALIQASSERNRPIGERVRSIGALALHPTPTAEAYLQQCSRRRFVFGSSARQVRAAARNAVRGLDV